MRTFGEKLTTPLPATAAKSTRASRAHLGCIHDVNSILHLQRTIGNQAVGRLLEDSASISNGQDFTRIPLHANPHAEVQPRLTTGMPGNIYEQEVDRATEQVMHMSESGVMSGEHKEGSSRARKPSPSLEPFAHTRMWSAGAVAPVPVDEVLRSPGERLPDSVIDDRTTGFDFSRVRVHANEQAADTAMMLDADAFSVGNHIVFGPGQYNPSSQAGRDLLNHELAHVIQSGGREPAGHPVMGESAQLESEARCGAPSRGVVSSLVQRHAAERVFKYALKWLEKRTAKQITKHIAKHTRRIASKAIHSVFRNPRAVKYMVTRTVKEASEVVGRQGAALATHVVEEGAIRVTRQATRTPGKFRWVIQKTFVEAIGTAGERVLRIVIDQSGRIVTAFPADRLIAIGITAAGIEAFSERTAEAAEKVHASVERQSSLEKAASEVDDSSWWDWVPIIGDIFGGSLNAGESQELAAQREGEERKKFVAEVVEAAIRDIEADKRATLGPDQRAEVVEFVQMVLASGLDLSEEDIDQMLGQ